MRTKEVFNTREVCHIFAKQSQQYGRNNGGNIYFEGKLIYSYGSHFCMAKIIDSSTVLITDRSYSNTTAKHLSRLRYALNHFNAVYVPYPNEGLEHNSYEWISAIKNELEIIGNTRKKEATRLQAKQTLTAIAETIAKYCDVTKQKFGMKFIDTDLRKEFTKYVKSAKNEKLTEELSAKLYESVKASQALALERRKEMEKEEKERQNEDIESWLSFSSHWLSHRISKVYLRTNGETLESSKGAKVSLKSAKVLFDMIQAGKDVKGFDIDGYTVISMNGVLTIGCHKIEREEIERFARSQNWIS